MKQRLLYLTKLFVGWPITIVSFFFIYRLISEKTNTLPLSLSDINFILLATSVFCFLVYFSLRVILWQRILLLKNHHTSFITTAFFWSNSEIKRFVPGNIWSLFSRIDKFSKKTIGKKEIFFAILEEAKIVVLSSLTVSIFSFSFVFSILFPSMPTIMLAITAWTTVATLVGIYLYLNPKNYQVLLYGIASFTCFSLGTYFSIASITALSPYYIATFVSFFSLCYLIGYLSFIVPMGLGVRETAITIGLSRFITEQTAAIAAIFSRVILIITELIFFCFTFFLYKTGEYRRWHVIILAFGIFFYILYFSSASIARYDNFYTGRFDLGNMDQTVWNTLRGRVFQLTDPNGTEIIYRLAFHADFLLIFLAPLYTIWPDPRMLLLVQTVVIAAGSIFVFLIARKVLNNKILSVALAFAYLFNPAIQHSNLYDFHAVTFATTFLLGAFYFLLQKQYVWLAIFSFLAGITKENIWFVIALFGFYIFLSEKILRQKVLGLFFVFISISLFYYLVWIAIPQARGGQQHFAISYYSDFGDNPTTIVKNALLSPQKILVTLLQKDHTNYIFQLFFPLGFLSFASPLFLVFSAPDFFITLMSNNSQLRQIYYHYSSPITPFIFISTIYGIKKIISSYPQLRTYIPFYLLATTILSAYFFGPLPFAKGPNISMFTETLKNKEEINKFLYGLNKEYSIAATNNLGSHLSQRDFIYTIPQGLDKADIVAFLLNDPSAQPSLAAQIQMANDLKQDSGFEIIFEKDDFVVFKRK